jgi:two-component system OmpR family response regulator
VKVLVVEDDEGTAEFISADRFDVIVLDRMLPKLDGLVALMWKEGRLRARPLSHQPPGLTTEWRDSRPAGDDSLVNPFAFEELMARGSVFGAPRSTQRIATCLWTTAQPPALREDSAAWTAEELCIAAELTRGL